MTYNPDIHHRRSIRLKGYDYSQSGLYFITMCTYKKEPLFGEIVNGIIDLNEYGKIVKNEWLKTSEMRPSVELDEFIIMPDHIHGIIVITDDGCGRGTMGQRWDTMHRALTDATTEQFGKPTSNTIPTIIRGFKAAVTKQINIIRNTPSVPVWQRNYYEHIIRNEESYIRISEYIKDNPLHWNQEEFDLRNSQFGNPNER